MRIGGPIDRRSGAFVSNTVDWNSAKAIMSEIDGNQLHILDCCYAGEAARPHVEITTTSTTESAPESLQTCFTRALIEELRAATLPVAVVHLYSAITNKHEDYRLVYRPVFTAWTGKPLIVLQKPDRHTQAMMPKLTEDFPRVIFTCLEGDFSMINISAFEMWLSINVPVAVGDVYGVNLEGVSRAQSTMVLVSMPLAVWAILSEDQQLNFVAMARFRNLMLQWAQEGVTGLSIRPRGTEKFASSSRKQDDE
ncbi:hypothetical protein K470DRAFT_278618 [Piedraia hortae CBS 480.64]|uniref:Uncharacterized protein n=1 Tax=Piedraia hortae CBS 480.64 TaxID=1314780 RepID=A0A6A7BTE0_9PEZI|nr:hypothetical protein K470DRAFT_278618 [Piedraia hortae CBS 480.64]